MADTEKRNPQPIGKQRLLKIAVLAAHVYAGTDWHKLSLEERELTALLEEVGLLMRPQPANGFVGSFSPAVAELVGELLAA